MKGISISLLISCLTAALAFGQSSLRPSVASEFGVPVIIDAEFVEKPNDYYSQNMISEAFFLRVYSVNGVRLEQPISIEYRIEGEAKKRPKWERLGVRVEFDAYESIYESGRPASWMEEWEQGRGFYLVSYLHIRPRPKKG